MDTSQVVIRRARPDDVPALCVIKWRLAVSEAAVHTVRAGEADWRCDMFGPHPRFSAYVADRAGTLIGFVTVCERFTPGWIGPTLYINDLFVVSEQRGGGIGKALLGRVAADAIDRGVVLVEINVRHDNPVRRLYRNAGFERVRNCESYVLAGQMLADLAQMPEAITDRTPLRA